MSTAHWNGLEFTVYPMDSAWSEVGGLYVFSAQEPGLQGSLQWLVLYVGETQSFAKRLPTHEKWPEAVQKGATHVLALTEQKATKRAELERKMISELQPPLNVQRY